MAMEQLGIGIRIDDEETRSINITLPPAVWEIVDGGNALANKAGGQNFEKWLSEIILRDVLGCLEMAEELHDAFLSDSKGGNV